MVNITSNFKEFKDGALAKMVKSADRVKYYFKDELIREFIDEFWVTINDAYLNPIDVPQKFVSLFGHPDYIFDEEVKFDSAGTENDLKIILEGDGLYFIEFGTGVHFNGQAVTIGNVTKEMGSFGSHQGLYEEWFYTVGNDSYFTRGTIATRPFYGTMTRVNLKASQIFRKAVKHLHD